MPRTTGTTSRQRVETPLNDFLKLIRSELHKEADTVPPGYKTASEFTRELGVTGGYARQLIREGINRGIIETQKFRVLDGVVIRSKPHYRIRPEIAGDKKHTQGTRDAGNRNGKVRQ